MPVDPPENFDPLRMSTEATTEMTGFSPRGERTLDLLREEATVEARHDCQPGGGTRVMRVDDPAIVADLLADQEARLEALGVRGVGSGTMPALPDQRGW